MPFTESVLSRSGDAAEAAPVSPLSSFREVRSFTEELTAPLAVEDYVVQSMTDVSPTKWHLAHTTWFFETFVLAPFQPGYRPFDPRYAFLFNSYYVQAGPRHCRAQRGYLSRPTVEEVFQYRAAVDERLVDFLDSLPEERREEVWPVVELGIHHEQQHQELILTDIKHVLAVNPLRPAYAERSAGVSGAGEVVPHAWLGYSGGVHEIGHDGSGFSFDNEGPRHRVYLRDFFLASRPVTNGEYLAFVEDGGYQRPDLWLSLGFATASAQDWQAPFYWERVDGEWHVFTLNGLVRLDPQEPVTHVSYFEADAYARWAGARLPTEHEWEVAAAGMPVMGNLAERRRFHPVPAPQESDGPVQLFGDVWEWTSSPYVAYPGFRTLPGALGEYNGKFMCNQFVLRGGSCATSATHVRPTYRNFFPPETTWQFMGIRLAQDPEQRRIGIE